MSNMLDGGHMYVVDVGVSFLQCVTGSRTCTTGIFLHKRFSNLPLELVGALHSNLEEDLGWSQQVGNCDPPFACDPPHLYP